MAEWRDEMLKSKRRIFTLIAVIMLMLVAIAMTGCSEEEHKCEFNLKVTNSGTLVSEATCEAAAKYYYSCSCGEVGEETFVSGEALGHYFSSWETTKTPTCTADGSMKRVCAVCNKSETAVTKGGHKLAKHDFRPATISASGNNEYYECLVCHEYFKDSASAEAISDKTSVLIPRLDLDAHTCVFGDRSTKYLATEATCVAPATYYKVCACGAVSADTFARGEALGHNYVDEGETVKLAPTCDTKGQNFKTCDRCGDVHETDTYEIDALGHDWSAPTCTADSVCVRLGCGVTDRNTALGHNYIKGNEPKVAQTCETDETWEYECSHCHDTYTEVNTNKLAKGHTADETSLVFVEKKQLAVTDASYATECISVYEGKCKSCEAPMTVEKENAHVFSSKTTAVATCAVKGNIEHSCDCGYVYNEEIAKNDAHNWEKDASLAGDTGRITYTCACGESKTVIDYSTKTEATVGGNAITETGEVELSGGSFAFDFEDDDKKAEFEGRGEIGLSIGTADLNDIANVGSDKYDAIVNSGATLYTFGITDSTGNIGDSIGGNVTVTLPYELAPGEDPNAITIFYVAEDGEIEAMDGVVYNPATETVSFTTSHFSYYTVTRMSPAERCAIYGHIYEERTVEATCISSGYRMNICTRCGDNTIVVIPALGHDMSGEPVVTPAGCTRDGMETYSCQREGCGYHYEIRLEATGHTWALDTANSKAASCTASGYELYVCDNDGCNESFKVALAQLEHSFETVVTEPTCTKGGHTTHTCSACGFAKVDAKTEALGHDHVVGEVIAPTCTEAGYTVYECSRCSDSYQADEVKPGHKWNIDKATCSVDKKCTVCGLVYETATGNHTIVNGSCSVCGAGCEHKFEIVVTAPTCTEGGYSTYNCSVCGYSKVDDKLAPLGHDYDSVVTAPTCDADGYTTHTCGVCGDVFVDSEVAATGHDYETTVVPPTCTEEGYTHKSCKDCDYETDINPVPATGHHGNTVCEDCGANIITGNFFANTLAGLVNNKAAIVLNGFEMAGYGLGYKINFAELYITLDENNKLSGYGSGIMIINDSNIVIEDAILIKAVIEEDVLYAVAEETKTAESGSTTVANKLVARVDLTTNYGGDMGDISIAIDLYKLAMNDLKPVLLSLIGYADEEINATLEVLVTKLFDSRAGEGGVEFTFSIEKLKALVEELSGYTMKEAVEMLLGEGSWEAIKDFMIKLPDFTAKEIREFLAEIDLTPEELEALLNKVAKVFGEESFEDLAGLSLSELFASDDNTFDGGEDTTEYFEDLNEMFDTAAQMNLYEAISGVSASLVKETFLDAIDEMAGAFSLGFTTDMDGALSALHVDLDIEELGMSLSLSVINDYTTENEYEDILEEIKSSTDFDKVAFAEKLEALLEDAYPNCDFVYDAANNTLTDTKTAVIEHEHQGYTIFGTKTTTTTINLNGMVNVGDSCGDYVIYSLMSSAHVNVSHDLDVFETVEFEVDGEIITSKISANMTEDEKEFFISSIRVIDNSGNNSGNSGGVGNDSWGENDSEMDGGEGSYTEPPRPEDKPQEKPLPDMEGGMKGVIIEKDEYYGSDMEGGNGGFVEKPTNPEIPGYPGDPSYPGFDGPVSYRPMFEDIDVYAPLMAELMVNKTTGDLAISAFYFEGADDKFSVSDDIEEEILASLSHKWELLKTVEPVGCTTPGEKHYFCACGATRIEFQSIGHGKPVIEYVFDTADKDCEKGITVKESCSVCGDVIYESHMTHHVASTEEIDLSELGVCDSHKAFVHRCPCGKETHDMYVENNSEEHSFDRLDMYDSKLDCSITTTYCKDCGLTLYRYRRALGAPVNCEQEYETVYRLVKNDFSNTRENVKPTEVKYLMTTADADLNDIAADLPDNTGLDFALKLHLKAGDTIAFKIDVEQSAVFLHRLDKSNKYRGTAKYYIVRENRYGEISDYLAENVYLYSNPSGDAKDYYDWTSNFHFYKGTTQYYKIVVTEGECLLDFVTLQPRDTIDTVLRANILATEGVIEESITNFVETSHSVYSFVELAEGAETCKDGVVIKDVCANCGTVMNESTTKSHVTGLVKLADLGKYNEKLNCFSVYTIQCACGDDIKGDELQIIHKNQTDHWCNSGYHNTPVYENGVYKDIKTYYVNTSYFVDGNYSNGIYANFQIAVDRSSEKVGCIMNEYMLVYMGYKGGNLPSEADFKFKVDSYESHNYVYTAELLPGAKTCDDGAKFTGVCSDCSKEKVETVYYHRSLKESFAIRDMGGACAGSFDIYSCACGRDVRYERNVDGFVAWINIYGEGTNDYRTVHKCAVTHPKPCGFIFAEQVLTKRDGCKITVQKNLLLGCDEEGRNALHTITLSTSSYYEHSYEINVAQTPEYMGECVYKYAITYTCDCGDEKHGYRSIKDHKDNLEIEGCHHFCEECGLDEYYHVQDVKNTATCTQNGIATVYCVKCEEVFKTYEVHGNGHKWKSTPDGSLPYACSVCGLENLLSADGTIVLEDCTDEANPDLIKIGYCNAKPSDIDPERFNPLTEGMTMEEIGTYYRMNIYISILAGDEQIDLLDGEVEISTAPKGRYVTFSLSALESYMAREHSEIEDYDIRVSFVPSDAGEIEYAITITRS